MRHVETKVLCRINSEMIEDCIIASVVGARKVIVAGLVLLEADIKTLQRKNIVFNYFKLMFKYSCEMLKHLKNQQNIFSAKLDFIKMSGMNNR